VIMLKNEEQYKSARVALQKWIANRAVLSIRHAEGNHPEWLLKEEGFAIDETIKQLEADIQEYEDTVAGKKQLPPPVAFAEELPDLLIRWRLARHWTQRQLAERLGMQENLIQKYESENYGCVSLHTIRKIAAELQGGESDITNCGSFGR